MKTIYMDNAATTKVRPEVLEAMLPYYSQIYGNASSVHGYGRAARNAVDDARGTVAAALKARPNEIYFTGSGTEADNWAVKMAGKRGGHVITSSVEHHAVLHACQWLEKNGVDVTYLPVDGEGFVSPDDVRAAIRKDTALITIMAANNEIGTIQPIKAIGAIARENNILFHADAVQAIGAIEIHPSEMNIDMLSLSAHKFHGPKGIGALYIRSGARLEQFIHGGAQERGKRAGTENVAAIVGMGKAMEIACADIPGHAARLSAMRDRLINGIINNVPDVRLNGPKVNRLPGNVNVSINYIEGEGILLTLDLMGIAASSGSACTSGSLDPSHVLLAIGLPHEVAHGSLRLSLSDYNTPDEVEDVIQAVGKTVERLRAMSPIVDDMKNFIEV